MLFYFHFSPQYILCGLKKRKEIFIINDTSFVTKARFGERQKLWGGKKLDENLALANLNSGGVAKPALFRGQPHSNRSQGMKKKGEGGDSPVCVLQACITPWQG